MKILLQENTEITLLLFFLFSLCSTRQIVCEYHVPAPMVTACVICGYDLIIFSGYSMLDGVTAGATPLNSTNPNDGRVYVFRGAVPCGGHCNLPVRLLIYRISRKNRVYLAI